MSQTNVSPSENTTEVVFSMRNVLWVTVGRVAGDAAVAAVTLVLAFFTGAWQLYTMAGVVWALVIIGGVGIGLIWRGRRKLGVWLIIGGLPVTLVAVGFLISGAGLLLAAIMLTLTSMVATQILPEKEARQAIGDHAAGGRRVRDYARDACGHGFQQRGGDTLVVRRTDVSERLAHE